MSLAHRRRGRQGGAMSDATDDEGTTAGTPEQAPGGEPSPQDEARRRFREALDRKRLGHHSGRSSGGPQAQHPHTAPAKPQKTFRRKSG
jgi:hypothetical protein